MRILLPIIEKRLAFVTGLPPERIRPWMGEDAPHFQADQDLVLRLAGISPDSGWFQGGGRFSCRVTERLEVQIRTRLALDPSGEARVWLTDAVIGHIQLRDKVLDALVSFIPTDADQNILTTDQLVMVPSKAPRQDGARGKPMDWGSETFTFEVNYDQVLTLGLSDVATE